MDRRDRERRAPSRRRRGRPTARVHRGGGRRRRRRRRRPRRSTLSRSSRAVDARVVPRGAGTGRRGTAPGGDVPTAPRTRARASI
eukprot:31068-Pelagococcus_subviridis.AAC.3